MRYDSSPRKSHPRSRRQVSVEGTRPVCCGEFCKSAGTAGPILDGEIVETMWDPEAARRAKGIRPGRASPGPDDAQRGAAHQGCSLLGGRIACFVPLSQRPSTNRFRTLLETVILRYDWGVLLMPLRFLSSDMR